MQPARLPCVGDAYTVKAEEGSNFLDWFHAYAFLNYLITWHFSKGKITVCCQIMSNNFTIL